MEANAQGLGHLEHGGKAGVTTLAERLVEALSTETGIARHRRHALVSGDIAQGSGYTGHILGGLQMDLQELLGLLVDVVSEKGLRERIRPRVLGEAIDL